MCEKKVREYKLNNIIYVVPLNEQNNISWLSMTKDEIIALARAWKKNFRLTGASQLSRGEYAFQSLYKVLRENGWINNVFPRPRKIKKKVNGKVYHLPRLQSGEINWLSLDDKYIVKYAKDYVREKNIATKTELKKVFPSLRFQLWSRELIDQVFPLDNVEVELLGKTFVLPKKGDRIHWDSMLREFIVEFAEAFIIHHKVKRPIDLKNKAFKPLGERLYRALYRRGFLYDLFARDQVRFRSWNGNLYKLPIDLRGFIDWASMTNKHIVKIGKDYILHEGIDGPRELGLKFSSLASTLHRRKLTAKVFPKRYLEEWIEGRKFKIERYGSRIMWSRVHPEILTIYAAMICRRDKTTVSKLTSGLRNKIDWPTVRKYIKKPPILSPRIMGRLRQAFGVLKDQDLPQEIFWAFGFESYYDKRIRFFGFRKLVPPENE